MGIETMRRPQEPPRTSRTRRSLIESTPPAVPSSDRVTAQIIEKAKQGKPAGEYAARAMAYDAKRAEETAPPAVQRAIREAKSGKESSSPIVRKALARDAKKREEQITENTGNLLRNMQDLERGLSPIDEEANAAAHLQEVHEEMSQREATERKRADKQKKASKKSGSSRTYVRRAGRVKAVERDEEGASIVDIETPAEFARREGVTEADIEEKKKEYLMQFAESEQAVLYDSLLTESQYRALIAEENPMLTSQEVAVITEYWRQIRATREEQDGVYDMDVNAYNAYLAGKLEDVGAEGDETLKMENFVDWQRRKVLYQAKRGQREAYAQEDEERAQREEQAERQQYRPNVQYRFANGEFVAEEILKNKKRRQVRIERPQEHKFEEALTYLATEEEVKANLGFLQNPPENLNEVMDKWRQDRLIREESDQVFSMSEEEYRTYLTEKMGGEEQAKQYRELIDHAVSDWDKRQWQYVNAKLRSEQRRVDGQSEQEPAVSDRLFTANLERRTSAAARARIEAERALQEGASEDQEEAADIEVHPEVVVSETSAPEIAKPHRAAKRGTYEQKAIRAERDRTARAQVAEQVEIGELPTETLQLPEEEVLDAINELIKYPDTPTAMPTDYNHYQFLLEKTRETAKEFQDEQAQVNKLEGSGLLRRWWRRALPTIDLADATSKRDKTLEVLNERRGRLRMIHDTAYLMRKAREEQEQSAQIVS